MTTTATTLYAKCEHFNSELNPIVIIGATAFREHYYARRRAPIRSAAPATMRLQAQFRFQDARHFGCLYATALWSGRTCILLRDVPHMLHGFDDQFLENRHVHIIEAPDVKTRFSGLVLPESIQKRLIAVESGHDI